MEMNKYVKWVLWAVAGIVVIVGGLWLISPKNQATDNQQVSTLAASYKNSAKPIKNGELRIGVVSAVPFQGSYLQAFRSDSITGSIFEPTGMGSIFKANGSAKIIDGGAANLVLDDDKKTATITLRKNLTWSDGQPVTAKDYEYAYELLANPAYESAAWTPALANIVGMAEYHAGTTDTIKGITFPDGENGKIIKVQFQQLAPGMKYVGSGFMSETLAPYHQLKDIAPADLAGSDANTVTPLSWGPFKVAKIVAGESVKMVPNPYWYGNKPKLTAIYSEIVNPNKVIASLSAHKYDTTVENPATLYTQMKKVAGYKITGAESTLLSMKTFNLGEFDADKGVNVMNRKTPLQDKRVRQAMGYALDMNSAIKKFYGGLGQRANTIIPAVFDVHDAKLTGFNYDVKKANKLLDDAGWKMNKQTGYREKNGRTLKFVYLARTVSSTSITEAQNFMQQWRKVGIKVTLYKGSMTDFNTWQKMMLTGSDDWDITDTAFGLASDPSQQSLFAKESQSNYGHFTSKKLTKLLNQIDSEKAMDATYRKQKFVDYQKYVNDEAFVLPYKYQLVYTPVNKRVTGWENRGTAYVSFWDGVGVDSNTLAKK
jgi:peptide/nickel transport system substrate-binding protein